VPHEPQLFWSFAGLRQLPEASQKVGVAGGRCTVMVVVVTVVVVSVSVFVSVVVVS